MTCQSNEYKNNTDIQFPGNLVYGKCGEGEMPKTSRQLEPADLKQIEPGI